MNFFKKHFEGVNLDVEGEVKVLCPFHHDHSPSAYINTVDGLFYCHVCQWGGNEEQFVAKLNGISLRDATKLLHSAHAQMEDWESSSKVDLWADEDFLSQLRSLGLSNQTIEDMNLGLVLYKGKKFLGVPVFFNKILVDIRRYNLMKHPNLPKMIGNEGAHNGFVIPFDQWDKTQTTYIFEGEKDMLIAREYGLNAITLTGGASALPNEYTFPTFKGTDIVLCYDNDKAGRDGMVRMAGKLIGHAADVHYVNIGELVKEEKEDFYDFIHKYNGSVIDFLDLTWQTYNVDLFHSQKRSLTTINSALKNNVLLRRLSSEVTVASEYSNIYPVPTTVKVKKMADPVGKLDEMEKDEERAWFLDDTNLDKVLELMEIDAKRANVDSAIRRFTNVNPKETAISITKTDYMNIYRCSVVDKRMDGSSVNLELYSLDKLQVGGQYIVTYTLFNHPTKNQQLVGVAHNIEIVGENGDYKVDKVKLSQLKTKGTIADRLDYLYQSAKHHIAKHLDFSLWLMSDLVFNSILDFNYGDKMSGALDVFLLGDTQVGKSETTSKMTELYNFGKFLSLKTSTTVGLIGGSNKVDGSWCNTIGAIPRQHKRLVVLEEFSGAKADFIKTMTDIRTSKILRIARASGELEVSCHLRMITISNPLNDDNGNPRFLSTFPNGVMPVMELIRSAEDVARYDGFMLIPKRENRFNPFSLELKGKPIPKECYEHKSEWVTTRHPENVKFEEGVEGYIWEQGEVLNKMFECNFPVFGTTTNKKLARFSVALASVLLNVDESYENIIVTKEIVDYMVQYLISIYTAPCFRLDAYKQEYDSYNEYVKEDIQILEKLYPAHTVMMDFLSKQSRTSRNNLKTVSGLDGDKFNPVFNQLVSNKFIRIDMENVYPTEKFRRVYPQIKKRSTSTGASLINSVNSTTQ